MSGIEKAISSFKSGFNCSQAVFSSYSEKFGLSPEIALKISSAFGGGMGRMGETCGAVTGAFMAIGLKYGMTKIGDVESKEKTYQIVQEFAKEFKSRNGSLRCAELLGCDIGTSEGMNMAREKNLFTAICPKLVKDGAEIIEKIL